MRLLFLLFVCIAGDVAFAQPILTLHTAEKDLKWVGQDVRQDAQILDFSQTIFDYKFDEKNGMVYILSHEGTPDRPNRKGQFTAYSIRDAAVLWEIPFNIKKDGFILSDTLPVIYSRYFSTAYNWRDGEKIWKGQYETSAVQGDLIIGYSPNYITQDELIGIKPSTGEISWKKVLEKDQEMEALQVFGDTAWLAYADGIDYTDMRTGEGFYFKDKRYATVGSAGGALVGGMMFGITGAIIGSLIIPSNFKTPDMTGRSQTFWAAENGHIYYLGGKMLYKFDMDGIRVWESPFNDKLFGNSKCFIAAGAIYAVFNGRAVSPDGMSIYGDSGIERHDLKTGELLVGLKLEEPIRDYLIKDSTIMMAFDTKIIEFRLSDLSIFKEKVYATEYGAKLGFDEIMNPPGYVRGDSAFLNTSIHQPDHFYAANKSGMKIEFDSEFELTRVIRRKDYFQIFEKFNADSILLKNEEESIWIDSRGRNTLPLTFTENMTFGAKWIYDQDEKKILIYGR